jgi:citrate lyase synthetase
MQNEIARQPLSIKKASSTCVEEELSKNNFKKIAKLVNDTKGRIQK